MDPAQIAMIAIPAVLGLILVIWFFSTWNRLVSLEENADQAWSNIDVLLNQRYDMIPNLVNIVQGYATHEREIFDQFAQARNTAAGALAQGDVKGVAAAEGMLSGLLPRINMVAEQYPDLKANQNFLGLQNQLVSMENSIADRREFYNAASTNFNKAIKMIPSNIVAGIKGCSERQLWTVQAHVRENVQITF
ncbi:MAG: LemA family protein [Poseidonia sp.]|jgi:LemA protein